MATVLVVEDNDDVREMMALALQLAGHTVSTAANGLEALHVLEGGTRPGLILCDLMMPVMDGWALRAALKASPEWAGIPVVMISAVADLSLLVGADGYLPKPIDLDDLMSVVGARCANGR